MKDELIEKFYSRDDVNLYIVYKALQHAPEEHHEELLVNAYLELANAYKGVLDEYLEVMKYLPKPVLKLE